jgi:uncharacterized membrane protein YeaQ/YmgE (transglycosylase-associated protein family)
MRMAAGNALYIALRYIKRSPHLAKLPFVLNVRLTGWITTERPRPGGKVEEEEVEMIGMNFSAFLTLLVLGLISSLVLHLVIRYRMLTGFDAFMGKWIAGWVGGWLGSPVFGHWGVHVGNLYLIPAVLGAFAGSLLFTLAFRALASTTTVVPRPDVVISQTSTASKLEMKKAS